MKQTFRICMPIVAFIASLSAIAQAPAPAPAAAPPPPAFAASNLTPHGVRSMAATCAACHGTEGRDQGAIPAIAGRGAETLYRALIEFKTGQRPAATVMHQHAKGYTDEQLALIAGYFASVTPGRAAAAPAAR